jgi:hypothetical protein
MKTKQSKAPKTLRTFPSPWSELDYLCAKVRYWLYVRKLPSRAERYTERLETVLRMLPSSDVAILQEEGHALLGELKQDYAKAITHREREILLMQRLHQEARSGRYDEATRTYMLQDRDTSALQVRHAILKALREKFAQHEQRGESIPIHSEKSTRLAV